MKAYLRLLKHLATCLFFFFTIRAFLYLQHPNGFQTQYLIYGSKIRAAIAVVTLDKDNLNDYYWKENITRRIEQYQAEGFYPLDGEYSKDIDSRDHYNVDSNNAHFLDAAVDREIDLEPSFRNLDKVNITGVQRGVIVDWWYDVCFERTTWQRSWYPLFPELPQNRTISLQAADRERVLGNYMRRISGLLYTKESGFYEIKFLSRDGGEMMICDTKTKLTATLNSKILQNIKSAESILYAKLSKREMDEQELNIRVEEMYTSKSHRVWLSAGVVYFVDLAQGGDLYTQFQMQWRKADGRKADNKPFVVIDENNLFYTDTMLKKVAFSKLLQFSKPKELFAVSGDERRRNSFFKIAELEDAGARVQKSPFLCKPTFLRPRQFAELYDGFLKNVENTISYPREFFLFKYKSRLKDMLMDEDEAEFIAEATFARLNHLYHGNLQLVNIVHVQKNYNETQRWLSLWEQHQDWRDGYYFVEFDVKKKDDYQNKLYRTAHFIRSAPGGPCFIKEYQWKSDVTINLLTPIRNQYHWLTYLVRSLEQLVSRIKEHKLNLIIVDNNSTDGDYRSILAESTLPYIYVRLNDSKFNKVKSLNLGMSYVKDPNSIVFIQDLHLQLPLNIFDRIRKMTVQGSTAFAPTLLKLACGEHEQYTHLKKSVWLDDGTGMLAMYKSDFDFIGGFNETLYSTKWGGEDWEIIDRIVLNGLYVIHHRMPRFYHLYHPKRGMWNQ